MAKFWKNKLKWFLNYRAFQSLSHETCIMKVPDGQSMGSISQMTRPPGLFKKGKQRTAHAASLWCCPPSSGSSGVAVLRC